MHLQHSHGATVEEMTIEVNKAKAALDTADKDFKNMSNLNKVRHLSDILLYHDF